MFKFDNLDLYQTEILSESFYANRKNSLHTRAYKIILIYYNQQIEFLIQWLHQWLHQWLSGNAQNWKTGGARFKPRSSLSTQPFGVFRGFLRNSRKYGIGSLRKTPAEGTPPIGLGPYETIGLTTNNQPTNTIIDFFLTKNIFKYQLEYKIFDLIACSIILFYFFLQI